VKKRNRRGIKNGQREKKERMDKVNGRKPRGKACRRAKEKKERLKQER